MSADTYFERKKEKLRKQYNSAGEVLTLKIKAWIPMMVDYVSLKYCISKNHLVRSLLIRAQRMDTIQIPKEHPLEIFNENICWNIYLSPADIDVLKQISARFTWPIGTALQCIIQTGITDEITRLNQMPVQIKNLDRLVHRQIYLAHDLRDIIFEIRDRRGESPSLLLKDALINYRRSKLPVLDVYPKEKNLQLRMHRTEWDRLDELAVASELKRDEAVQSLFMWYYFRIKKQENYHAEEES
tara:strand:+ start:2152 stop:2877 length:726 start_codon:yes stop_codon:yes gene_type:complete